MTEDPFDSEEWTDYARRALDELVPMIRDSAVTVSLVPTGETDVKFALELGMSIMLDKPIIALIPPGAHVPDHLVRVADRILEYDPDDPGSTYERMTAAVEELVPGEPDVLDGLLPALEDIDTAGDITNNP